MMTPLLLVCMFALAWIGGRLDKRLDHGWSFLAGAFWGVAYWELLAWWSR